MKITTNQDRFPLNSNLQIISQNSYTEHLNKELENEQESLARYRTRQ